MGNFLDTAMLHRSRWLAYTGPGVPSTDACEGFATAPHGGSKGNLFRPDLGRSGRQHARHAAQE